MNTENTSYFSRSWKMLTRHKGWIKPVLVLALVQVVPIVGALALLGFSLEWARLSAWGVDSSPKQSGVRVGECIASGWRGFVVIVVWMIPWGVVVWLINHLTGTSSSDFVSILLSICTIVVAVVAYAAALRAAIYTKISAGLKFSRVIEMVRRDPKGLFRISLIPLVTTLIVVVLGVLAVAVFMLVSADSIAVLVGLFVDVYYMGGVTSSLATNLVLTLCDMLGVVLVLLVVFGYPVTVIQTAASLLEVNSVGLWMAQFDVPRWGGSGDPLPEANGLPAPDPAPVPPEQAAAPEPEPEVAPAPVVAPAPEPEAVAVPEPAPEPVVEPAPETAVEPAPEPVVAPVVEPEPEPEAVPNPAPSEQGEHESSTNVSDFAESEGQQEADGPEE